MPRCIIIFSRDHTAENDPLGQRRVPAVRDAHIGLAAVGVGADVHVHEGLALVGPLGDLDQVLLVGVELEVVLGVDDLLVDVVLEAALRPRLRRDHGLWDFPLQPRQKLLRELAVLSAAQKMKEEKQVDYRIALLINSCIAKISSKI